MLQTTAFFPSRHLPRQSLSPLLTHRTPFSSQVPLLPALPSSAPSLLYHTGSGQVW